MQASSDSGNFTFFFQQWSLTVAQATLSFITKYLIVKNAVKNGKSDSLWTEEKSYVGIFLDLNWQKYAESVDQIPVAIKIWVVRPYWNI